MKLETRSLTSAQQRRQVYHSALKTTLSAAKYNGKTSKIVQNIFVLFLPLILILEYLWFSFVLDGKMSKMKAVLKRKLCGLCGPFLSLVYLFFFLSLFHCHNLMEY